MGIAEFLEYLNDDSYVIGEFAVGEPVLEARQRIPNTKGTRALGNFTVEIRQRETCGKGIPHFHVYGKNGFETCVKIQSPEYFLHGKYKDKFNGKEILALIEFLNSGSKSGEKTNWESLKSRWTNMHPDDPIPDNIKMPDYTKLPRRK